MPILFKKNVKTISAIQLFFFIFLVVVQTNHQYSLAIDNASSYEKINNQVIDSFNQLHEMVETSNNRKLPDLSDCDYCPKPGIANLIYSEKADIFIKAAVFELVLLYAQAQACKYYYEFDKIKLLNFIFKEDIFDIIKVNIEKLENYVADKIVLLHGDSKENLKSVIEILISDISKVKYPEARYCLKSLVKKISEKIIGKNLEGHFNYNISDILSQLNDFINLNIQNFDDNYIKDARAWWAIVIGVFGAGVILAALGSFFLGWGMIIFWYYTPNVKMACHCSRSLIKIYDLWPFIKKPDRRYMFPNSILAYSAFINKNYQESIKWADEWILNADGPANNDNNEKYDLEQLTNKNEAKILKARALMGLNRHVEAITLLTGTIPFYTLIGMKYIPFMYLGNAFKETGHPELALENYKIAASHEFFLGTPPDIFVAYYGYASVLDQLGNGNKALEYYKKADKACKSHWFGPPQNKQLSKEYRTLIDEAWVLQVVVVDDNPTCKEEMPVIKVNILPGETVKFRVSGITVSGNSKALSANKLKINISDNSAVYIDKIYQAGIAVIAEIGCTDEKYA